MDWIYLGDIRHGKADSMSWNPFSRKVFEVKSFYKVLLPASAHFFPWKSVWRPKVPSKVCFFLWTVALGRVLTTDNLRRRRLCS